MNPSFEVALYLRIPREELVDYLFSWILYGMQHQAINPRQYPYLWLALNAYRNELYTVAYVRVTFHDHPYPGDLPVAALPHGLAEAVADMRWPPDFMSSWV